MQDLSYDAPADAELFVQPEQGLLSHGGGAAARGWKAAVDTQTAHGTLAVSPTTGSFTFTPKQGYKGPDSFTFHTEAAAADGSTLKSATRTVSLDIGGGLPRWWQGLGLELP